MGLELILVIMSILVGLNLTLFASKIGIWWFNIYENIRRDLPDSLSTVTLGHLSSPVFFIWLIRITGIGLVGGAFFILYMVLFI